MSKLTWWDVRLVNEKPTDRLGTVEEIWTPLEGWSWVGVGNTVVIRVGNGDVTWPGCFELRYVR